MQQKWLDPCICTGTLLAGEVGTVGQGKLLTADDHQRIGWPAVIVRFAPMRSLLAAQPPPMSETFVINTTLDMQFERRTHFGL